MPQSFLQDAGVDKTKLLEALKEVRGSHRVTDQTPEEKYQALERFGRDLTEAARRGKLDPVIGRDSEIRRVVQLPCVRHPLIHEDEARTVFVHQLAQHIARRYIALVIVFERLQLGAKPLDARRDGGTRDVRLLFRVVRPQVGRRVGVSTCRALSRGDAGASPRRSCAG